MELQARLPGAREIVFYQHAREVGRIAGAEGDVRIDPRRLGQGPSRIQPVAVLETGAAIWGPPLEVNVVPPALSPARELPSKQRLEPGFLLTPADQPTEVLQQAQGDWLSKAGVVQGASFKLEAWFDAPEDDVYQFQIRGDARALSVDGVEQDWPRGETWWFVPVPLARGLHHLHLSGIAAARPALDTRFGNRGT